MAHIFLCPEQKDPRLESAKSGSLLLSAVRDETIENMDCKHQFVGKLEFPYDGTTCLLEG